MILHILIYSLCLYTIHNADAEESTDCADAEALQFSLSAVDVGVLLAGGCDSLFNLRASQSCCDTASEIIGNPCFSKILTEFEESWPLVDFVFFTMEVCRLKPSVGYDLTGCPDGVVTGEEQCDDGNAISGDGCSSYCFVEDGYDCFPDNNGTSICWQCEEECFIQGRAVCNSPGEPCGDCTEEFKENEFGLCAFRKHVYYAAVTRYNDTENSTCFIHDVGEALEGTPVISSKPYLDVVRMWMPERSVLGSNVTCSLKEAMRLAPEVDNVVLVLEIFVPAIDSSEVASIRKYSTHTVIFSDIVPRPRLEGNRKFMFQVLVNSGLYLRGLSISGGMYARGSFIDNFGTASIEDCVVSDILEDPRRLLRFTDEASGIIASSFGRIRLEDTVFRSSTIHSLPSAYPSIDFVTTVVDLIGSLFLSNVTFSDIYAGEIFARFRFIHESSYMRMLYFERIHSESSLMDIATHVSIDGLYVCDCHSADGLISLSQTSYISNFSIFSNEVEDDLGIILNIGKAYLQNGVIAETFSRSELDRGGSIVNRGELYLARVFMDSNYIGDIRTTFSAHLYLSNFSTPANPMYPSVHNAAELVVDGCIFVGPAAASTIVSEEPIILRNTILPEDSFVSYVTCWETLQQNDGGVLWPCGFNANCTVSTYSGVNCTCAPGHIGSPTVMCGPPAAVHVLPDTDVVGFVTKDGYDDYSEELLGLLSDGLGTVTWSVVEETLPDWIRLSPANGSFVQIDPCLSEMVDLYVTFSAEYTRGNDTYHEGLVEITTSSVYDKDTVYNSIVLSVKMIVEVLAVANTSDVALVNTLRKSGDDEGVYEVEAGSIVSVVVDLRDSSGYSLGVGGSGYFVVHPTQLTSIDYENGTHVVTFEAPQTHFEIAVIIREEHIQGSPIILHVRCARGDYWDEEKNKCMQSDMKIPKDAIGIGTAVAFVCATFAIFLMRKRKRSFQADFFHTETASTLSWIFVDLVDIGTDIGAYRSVNETASLSSYAPWYLAAVCVAVLFSLVSLRARLRALRTIISESGQLQNSISRFVQPIPLSGVDGMSYITSPEDFDFAILQLQRKFRAHVLSVIGLFVEDLPMQILNTIMLCTSGSDYPVEVLVSTEVTCILIGVKLTKVARARQIRENIRRVQRKAQVQKVN